MTKPREPGDLVDYNGVSRFLKRNNIRLCCPDHRGNLFSAADSAFANVVSE